MKNGIRVIQRREMRNLGQKLDGRCELTCKKHSLGLPKVTSYFLRRALLFAFA